jgi:peptidoglycan lytic transglycosylase B
MQSQRGFGMAQSRPSRRLIVAAPLALLPQTARGATSDFAAFLAGVRRDAEALGVRAAMAERALGQARYLPHVIELDHRQPERVLSFAEYLDRAVSRQRIDNGRKRLADNRALLDGVARHFGVAPRFIVALWGIESDFGKIMGSYPVVSALATLGYDGRRSRYFRGELIAALRVLDQGNIGTAGMTGSWAGAMGQCQFMPSTFLGYAVDYDGDGRRDIWNDRADVFASIANFIAHLGWRSGEGWGREVMLPRGFDARFAGLDAWQPVAQWRRLGLRDADGRPLEGERQAALLLPDGVGGRAFLVYDNFRTIMRWNRSTYFAAAVGCLADRVERG